MKILKESMMKILANHSTHLGQDSCIYLREERRYDIDGRNIPNKTLDDKVYTSLSVPAHKAFCEIQKIIEELGELGIINDAQSIIHAMKIRTFIEADYYRKHYWEDVSQYHQLGNSTFWYDIERIDDSIDIACRTDYAQMAKEYLQNIGYYWDDDDESYEDCD